MPKGSIGTPTSTIIKLPIPTQIPCDCRRCKHLRNSAGTTHCTHYDIIAPSKKTCARYDCVRSAPKEKNSQKKGHKKRRVNKKKKK